MHTKLSIPERLKDLRVVDKLSLIHIYIMSLFFLQPIPSACLAFQPFFKVFAGLPFNELFKGFLHGFITGKLPYHDKLYFFTLLVFLLLRCV